MGIRNKTVFRSSLLAAAILAAGAAGFFIGRYVADTKKPCFTRDYVLYVYPDTDCGTVIDSLMTGAGALRRGSLERCAAKEELVSEIKPGRYVIEPSFPAVYVSRMLRYGWQTPQEMTLSGTIRSKGRLAQKIGRQMMVDSAQVADALCDTAFLAGYGFTPENIFAMFLPDTYQIYWTDSVKEIFDRMKKEYDTFWTDGRKAAAAAQGLTPYEVSVMASIVSGETLKAFEYPKIAGVYLNRLHSGMKLQADPTVKFAWGDFSLRRILNVHLAIESPYNTYRVTGLPPGPIRIASKQAIDAVLNHKPNGYYYMCAKEDFSGYHNFATTLAEHRRNAARYQRELNRRGIR